MSASDNTNGDGRSESPDSSPISTIRPGDEITPSMTRVNPNDSWTHNSDEIKAVPEIEEVPNVQDEKRQAMIRDIGNDSPNTDSRQNDFTPFKLARMAESKSLDMLEAYGGTESILRGLGTDAKRGLSLSASEIEERQRVYGRNVLPTRKSKTLLQLMWMVLQQKVLVLLSCAAIVALALGLFQDFGVEREQYSCGDGSETCTKPPVDWVKGVAIMIAVAIVVVFSSLNDWQKERQFKELNEKKDDRTVKVIRDGNETVVNIKDLIVGDVAILDPGEIAPCDGVFLSGYNVRCDESSITGESDAIKKVAYAEYRLARASGNIHPHTDCFVISGSKILEGVGNYVIVAVGELSCNGRIMMAMRSESDDTPMQKKLKKLADLIAKLATTVSLLLFTVLLIRFFVQLGSNSPPRTSSEKGVAFVDILVISVSVFVVAIPEGLPLAVTLALALATRRMTAEKLLVRVLSGCETMANATVICTDKTGTLTQNEMAVVAGAVGVRAKFVRRLAENPARSNAGEEPGLKESTEQKERRLKHVDDFSLDESELEKVLSPALKRCFNEAICVNSTAFEDMDHVTGERVFVGSKTETALLRFAKELGWPDYQATRANAKIVQMIPFSSERKAMGVVVETRDGQWRLYLKGASEILTKKCTRHVVVARPDEVAKDNEDEIETAAIDNIERDNISRNITFYASQALRTIAVCYRELESWPPKGLDAEGDEVSYDDLATDLTLIGITAIEDPLREGVTEAVAQCRRAGVQVKMCTGDNVLTARSIAQQCGIYAPGGVVMEGPVFRELDDREMLEVVPKLQVLARSSPEDKKILVEKLKELGEVVGVTGDGTNDGPALKTAHVGFSMGLTGTEVAKEASDIILMDDNFANIVKAIMWGRCVNDALRKFLQFQISANITAVLITFISAVARTQDNSALSAVQLLWVNIIMNTFAALALATDPATPALLDRTPDKMSASLFTVDMYKQILGQALYQTTIILVFHFAGESIFNLTGDDNNEAVQFDNKLKLSTLVFNAFVFAQIFNSINCRRIGNHKNIFHGMYRNPYFIGILLIEIGCQIIIVFFGGQAFSVTDISGKFWGISLALGVVSIPLGFLIRCISNPPIERFFCKIGLMRDRSILPTERPSNGTGADENEDSHVMKVLDKLRFWSPRSSVAFSRSTTLIGTGVANSSVTPKLITNREIGVLPASPSQVGSEGRRAEAREINEKTNMDCASADNANANG
ncbi:PMC1_2 [Sanghuangporus vaninii]